MRAALRLTLLLALGAGASAYEYNQPTWDRRDESGGEVHSLLERAAREHQQGELESAVSLLRQALKINSQHGEAYASLSKCYADQGKDQAAKKAMQRATKIHNQQLSSWNLF